MVPPGGEVRPLDASVLLDASAEASADAALASDEPPAERDGKRLFALRFALRAGDQPFGCGRFASLGSSNTRVQPTDARFYVHDVSLLRANGERVALELDQDQRWQSGNVALLDFVDDSGACATGDKNLRTVVYGYAAAGADYTGIAFKLGVPEDRNHLDGALAPAPFNASGMWWSWSGGYKYAKIDLTSAEQPVWYFHAGAAGCSGVSNTGFTCAARQLAQIELSGWDVNTSLVVFDAAKLYAGVDLSKAADSLPGCMGGKDDPECKPLYAALGVVPWDDAAERPEQTVFSVQQGDAWQASGGGVRKTPRIDDPTGWPQPDFMRPTAFDIRNVSEPGATRSHPVGDPRHGASCMRCHQAQGPGLGRFTAAGTVFREAGGVAQDVLVEIIAGTPDRANNTFKDVTRYALLDVDANGNFFTTEAIPYAEQKLTARLLRRGSGEVLGNMFSTKQTGVCNTCHTAGFRLTVP
ncbi:MAG TPA: MbnP family copper-binding protein [Polyangiales bacterium]|nr:MbnP family copper-binding protein [Polyangiales bacterium]